MILMQKFLCFVLFCLYCNLTDAVPKYEDQIKNYDEQKSEQWRRQYYNKTKPLEREQEVASTKDRLQRLGYSTGYGTLNGYPAGTGLSAYNPIKLDLGGVVLGTIVGIGAIIIIPKILSAFHGGYAGYGRSENENELMSFSSMINKIDDILIQNNIDSTSCMQRAICTYVKSSELNIKSGSPDQMDDFVHVLSENSLVDYLLDGTAIKEAVVNGKKAEGQPCDQLYPSCPVDSQSATNILMKLLPKKSTNKPNSTN